MPPPSPPPPAFPPFVPLAEGEAVVSVPATVLSVTLRIPIPLSEVTAEARATLRNALAGTLLCTEPMCYLVLRLSSGSVVATATLTIPSTRHGGAIGATTPAVTVASVQAAATALVTSTPADISAALGGVPITSADPSVDVRTNVLAPIVVAPPPPAPPSPPSPSPPVFAGGTSLASGTIAAQSAGDTPSGGGGDAVIGGLVAGGVLLFLLLIGVGYNCYKCVHDTRISKEKRERIVSKTKEALESIGNSTKTLVVGGAAPAEAAASSPSAAAADVRIEGAGWA